MVEPLWPELDDLVEVNRIHTEAEGEPHILRDRGALEMAINHPINAYHYGGEDDVLVLAVVLMMAVARNHPFIQGNKRTGFDAGVLLLELNGYTLDMDGKHIAEAFKDAVIDPMQETCLIEMFRNYLVEQN